MTYAEKLKDPRWQRKRLDILNRDDFTCRCCSDKTEELHVHHIKYNSNPWEADDEDLITVCKKCHTEIEKAKLIFKGAESRFMNEYNPRNFIETARIVRTIYEHQFDGLFLNKLESILITGELFHFVEIESGLISKNYGSKD